MSNVLRLFSTAGSALRAYQIGLEVTGNNIANVNTEGYSRQTVEFEDSTSIRNSRGYIGTGVNISRISRKYDFLLSRQHNRTIEEQGRWEEENKFLKIVETVFNETADGELSTLINGFFNEWSNLANKAEDMSFRESVLSSGRVLAGRINQVYVKLKETRDNIDDNISASVSDIDRYAKEIADLNRQIMTSESGNVRANSLRDARDSAISALSKLIDVTALEQNNGFINIAVAGSAMLVSGTVPAAVEFQLDNSDPNNPEAQILLNGFNVVPNVSDGEVKGFLNVRNNTIPSIMTDLDNFAAALISEVNAVHSQGYGLSGNTGLNFFTPFTQATPGNNQGAAGVIALSTDVTSDAANIAAAQTNAPGDNSNALLLANVQNAAVSFTPQRTQTFVGFYAETISRLGGVSREAGNALEHSNALEEQMKGAKASLSGVSLDAELANMVRYQQVYQSAARFFTTANQIMDTVINRLGA